MFDGGIWKRIIGFERLGESMSIFNESTNKNFQNNSKSIYARVIIFQFHTILYLKILFINLIDTKKKI